MKKIGIIDIGSNSVRLILVEIYSPSSYRIIDDLKETVRLGDELFEGGKIKKSRFEFGIKTMRMFKGVLDIHNVDEVMAVATAAVRKASNGKEFISSILCETGIEARILTGREEAEYDYLGVISTIDIYEGLIIDIGGGSTEFIYFKNRKIQGAVSIPIGSLDISENFDIMDIATEEKLEKLEVYLRKNLEDIEFLKNLKNLPIIGVGGTIRNIGKIHRRKINFPHEMNHNYRLYREDVEDILINLKDKNCEGRKKVRGISKYRSDIIVGVTKFVDIIMEYCKSRELVISASGLREGLLFEYFGYTVGNPVDDVLDFSVNNLIEKYRVNISHSKKVFSFADKIYKKIYDNYDEEDYSKVIKASSLLHDSGIFISYENHHENSFYMIINSKINGLTQKEIIMSAFIAASHRAKNFKISMVPYKNIFSKKDLDRIKKLGMILRIAESLDRSLNSVIDDISIEYGSKKIIIKVYSRRNADLEIEDAMQAAKAFKNAFGKELEVLQTI